ASSMCLYDGTTDRQSHSHATGLGGVECVEQLFDSLWCQSWTEVLYRDEHSACPGFAAADLQFLRPLVQSPHRFHGVDDQVEDHLFELDPISINERQRVRELRLYQDAVLPRLATGEHDHLADSLVDVHAILARRCLLDEGTDAVDDVTSLIAARDDAIE